MVRHKLGISRQLLGSARSLLLGNSELPTPYNSKAIRDARLVYHDCIKFTRCRKRQPPIARPQPMDCVPQGSSLKQALKGACNNWPQKTIEPTMRLY